MQKLPAKLSILPTKTPTRISRINANDFFAKTQSHQASPQH